MVTRVQNATNCWANLLQATGGSLKSTKCYWYLLSYKFVNGVAIPRHSSELTSHKVTIPQQANQPLPIQLLDPSTPSKVLGVWTAPVDDGLAMMQHMSNKGAQWASRIQASTLHPREVWYSLTTQALPSVRYGLMTLMATRECIDKYLPKWYFDCLPKLGINRHIAIPWRTLPRRFQGLGLPVFSLEKLADCLSLLQRHWNSNSTLGRALKCSFELVQLETGLAGNFLSRNFTRLGNLATHSWLKLLWELIHHYQVKIEFPEDVSIPPLRQHDKILMEVIIKILPPSQWIAFNRVRKFHQIYFVSQLTLCDGKNIHPCFLTNITTQRSTMTFPKECPTADNFALWNSTLRQLTSPSLTLPSPLGPFIRLPYTHTQWLTNPARTQLILSSKEGDVIYVPSPSTSTTRQTSTFIKSVTTTRSADTTLLASPIPHSNGSYRIHSSAPLHQINPCTNISLMTYIREHAYRNLFKHAVIDDDGTWIIPAAHRGSLIIVHDGSYIPHIDDSVCSTAVVLLCTETSKMGTIHLCEKSNRHTASNYRGELLGGIITGHILNIIDRLTNTSAGKVTCYCDNMGVIKHANNKSKPLSEKQPQLDALLSFRHLLTSTKTNWKYDYVESHLDTTHSIDHLPIPQRLNVWADNLAKNALITAHRTNRYTKPEYPGETVRLFLDGHKVTSSIKRALYSSWGTRVAKPLFDKKKLLPSRHFDLVDWDNVDRTITSLPKMLQVWITKHVSGFCGTNTHLSLINPAQTNRCQCCGSAAETTKHITRCPNPGRVKMFDDTVTTLINWMDSKHGYPPLTHSIHTYLRFRGRRSMTVICTDVPTLSAFARDHDRLGWDNFIMGRISTSLLEVQQAHLRQSRSHQSISSWACQFTQRLLAIPHQQWLYRNA